MFRLFIITLNSVGWYVMSFRFNVMIWLLVAFACGCCLIGGVVLNLRVFGCLRFKFGLGCRWCLLLFAFGLLGRLLCLLAG